MVWTGGDGDGLMGRVGSVSVSDLTVPDDGCPGCTVSVRCGRWCLVGRSGYGLVVVGRLSGSGVRVG